MGFNTHRRLETEPNQILNCDFLLLAVVEQQYFQGSATFSTDGMLLGVI